MKKLIDNFWFRLLLAPVFTLLTLGLWAFENSAAILFIDIMLWFIGGLLIWVIALKAFLERK